MELSRSYTPGYWGCTLPSTTSAALDAIAALMIPGQDPYPPASEVAVATFIESHCDPDEAALLTGLADAFVSAGSDVDALRAIEAASPVEFGLLRFYVYSAYYCAPAVLAVIGTRSDYHASPQPMGYAVDAEVPVPTVRRGAFVPTEEVRNVFRA
jgi:hypothetical protein